jgi:di/tripeptidase
MAGPEDIEPIRTPIRGGTGSSRLNAIGLPTLNIFAGGPRRGRSERSTG